MRNEYAIGKLAGLQLSITPSALIGLAALWITLTIVAIALLHLTALEAIVGGLIATLLHWASELVHQLGHARAARLTGYPMRGVRFWYVFGISLYPDEPELPAQIHIRRALGGAPVNALVAMLAVLLLLALNGRGGLLGWLALFVFLDNLFVFALGSFLPLGFTDGSSLWKWWGKR